VRRNVVWVIVVIGALAALVSVAPIGSVAQTPTITPTSDAGLGPTPTEALCESAPATPATPEATPPGFVIEPPGDGGVVVGQSTATDPYSTDRSLWVVELTLQPGSCYEYHYRLGPVVLFVRSGTIQYVVHATPPAEVNTGFQGDAATSVTPDAVVTLNPGDWVTQDRAVWFTYRNPGPGAAVLIVAATEPGSPDKCSGGCHRKG
jgi:hypothetical protein